MSTPGRKRRTTTKKKQVLSTLSPSLPDELVLIIVARVPILYYPTLKLVSKSFRSLLASPELYKVRSLLGHTESCLHVCFLMCPSDKGPLWFTLCRKPDRTLTNDTNKEMKSSGYVLARVPMAHSPCVRFSSLVAVGSDIYNIGVTQAGFKASSSCVSILDCRSHTWREAPSLPVELFTVSAGVLDGKIYVAGRSQDEYSPSMKNSCQVFDIKTQVWDPEPIPCTMRNDNYFGETACIDGKFNVATYREVVAYDPKEGRWEHHPPFLSDPMSSDSYCEVDNVLYSAAHGAFTWYDSQVRQWRDLKGLVGLPKFPPRANVRLADYGGKIVVMWDVIVPSGLYLQAVIWCAEIALERLNSCEIWGKVEWVDRLLTISGPYGFVKVIAATL